MQNTAINTLGYTGIVTISQCIGKEKIEIAQIHNTGGTALFNFLADCLLGDFELAAKSRPTKIMLLERKTSTDTSQSVEYISSSGFIHLLTKPEKIYSNTEGKVRYSFRISRDMLESTNKPNAIALYTKDIKDTFVDITNWAAIVENVGDYLQAAQITASALIVDWELIISNKNTNSNASDEE